AALEAAGTPFAAASNSRRDRLDRKLRAAGLDGQVRLSLDPGQVGGRGKPLPDLYLRAAEELGCDIRACLVIEDSATGVQAGVAAGARVWGLTAGGHAGPGLAAQLLDAGAERVLAHHAEVRAALGLGEAEQADPLSGHTAGGR
ncbi:MAG: HAD family hydrolase, partial [Deinococcus sp.]